MNSPSSDRRDIVGVFVLSWRAAQARGANFAQDRLMVRLLSHERIRRAVIAQPFRSRVAAVSRSVLGETTPPLPITSSGALFEPLRLRRRTPSDVEASKRSYEAYGRMLAEKVSATGLRQPGLIVCDPLAAGFCEFAWADRITLYLTDDYLASPAHARQSDALAAAYTEIANRQLQVAAVSETILDRVGPTGPTLVTPNAVDRDEWARPSVTPTWSDHLPRPLAVYIATIDSRLDTGAVKQIADAIAPGTVVLVGPCTDTQVRAALDNTANVRFVGRQSWHDVPGILAAADIALLPHRDTDLTRAMSPLKVYEALAAGKSIVATDLPGVRGIHPKVILVPTGGDFAEAARLALQQGGLSEDERTTFLDEHSWSATHDQLIDFALGPSPAAHTDK